MISFDQVAGEVFQILRSHDYTVRMYDDDGNQVYEPEEARRMFASPENIFVSILDDGEDSRLLLVFGKSTDVADIMGLINTLRSTAVKYNMTLNDRQYGRDIEPADFATKASVTEGTKMIQQLVEGMYGTTRSSYLKLENARLIVRHTKRVDEEVVGGRSRNIDAIFIENAQGERFLFPTRQLLPARAMAQHVNQGNSIFDQIGQQITSMAQDYAALGAASSFIGFNSAVLPEAAMSLREDCRSQMKESRRSFNRLFRESGYMAECDALSKKKRAPLTESDDNLLEEIRSNLFVEGKEIDESIIVAVAEAVKQCKCQQQVKEDLIVTVKVMGQPVNADVWNRFKGGELALSQPMDAVDGMEPSAVFDKMIPLVVDESMRNLLTHARSSPKLKGAPVLLSKALSCSGAMPIGLPTGMPSIREFEEWMSGFKAEKALTESPWHPEDPSGGRRADQDAASEHALEQVVNTFSLEDFLETRGHDFGWPIQDGDDLNYDLDYIKDILSGYLSAKAAGDYGIENLDARDYVGDVLPDVMSALSEAGYSLTEGDLSREDVLIPTDQQTDLQREVTDPEAMPGDIERMRALAGLSRW